MECFVIPTPANPRMAAWLESAWLARYLDRQLDGEELAWFEAYLLDKPELLDVVEADTTLRDALAAGRASADSPAAGDRRDATAPAGKTRHVPSWLGLAAAAVVGVGVGVFAQRAGLTAGEAPLVANPGRIVFDTMRGVATERRHEEPGDPASPIVLLEVAIPPGGEVLSAEVEVDGRRVALPAPHVSSEGFATYAVPSAWRNKGRIVVSVGGTSPGLPPTSLEFSF